MIETKNNLNFDDAKKHLIVSEGVLYFHVGAYIFRGLIISKTFGENHLSEGKGRCGGLGIYLNKNFNYKIRHDKVKTLFLTKKNITKNCLAKYVLDNTLNIITNINNV